MKDLLAELLKKRSVRNIKKPITSGNAMIHSVDNRSMLERWLPNVNFDDAEKHWGIALDPKVRARILWDLRQVMIERSPVLVKFDKQLERIAKRAKALEVAIKEHEANGSKRADFYSVGWLLDPDEHTVHSLLRGLASISARAPTSADKKPKRPKKGRPKGAVSQQKSALKLVLMHLYMRRARRKANDGRLERGKERPHYSIRERRPLHCARPTLGAFRTADRADDWRIRLGDDRRPSTFVGEKIEPRSIFSLLRIPVPFG
jgi:hypothetical protein